jgi:hypothetical protein
VAQKYTDTVAKCEEIDESTMKIHIFIRTSYASLKLLLCGAKNEFVPRYTGPYTFHKNKFKKYKLSNF